MIENREIILQKQRRRYQLLIELWKAGGGKEFEQVNFDDVATASGFSSDEANEIYLYFIQEETLFQLQLRAASHAFSQGNSRNRTFNHRSQ